MLLTMKYFGKRYPKLKWMRPLGPISACVIAIIAAVAGDLQNKGIHIVGHIPKGKSWHDCISCLLAQCCCYLICSPFSSSSSERATGNLQNTGVCIVRHYAVARGMHVCLSSNSTLSCICAC
jgi:hypothetical protein